MNSLGVWHMKSISTIPNIEVVKLILAFDYFYVRLYILVPERRAVIAPSLEY